MTVLELYQALEKEGHFPLMTITIEDLMERDIARSKEEAFQLCKEISSRWDCGDDYEMALQYALEIQDELLTK